MTSPTSLSDSAAESVSSRPEPLPGSFREVWNIAFPLVLSSGSVSLMHFVDRLFLMRYSTDALAAAMPAGMLYWSLVSVPMGMVTYVNAFVAQYEGAQRRHRVAASVWQGVWFSLLIGAVLMLVAPLSPMLFRAIGHEPQIQVLESAYFGVLCLGSATLLLSSALSCFFSGRGLTAVVMWVNIAATLVNIVLDYLLIFGWGPVPALGIAGAAWGTVIASGISAALFAALIVRDPQSAAYGVLTNVRPDRELLGRLMRYGLPNSLQYLVDIAGFSIFILIIGMLGTEVLAATSLAFNLNTLAFLPMLGIGTAVVTLVGRRIGEGRPELAARSTWTAFKITAVYMLAFGGVYLFLPDVILYPYAVFSQQENYTAIRDVVVVLLRFVAIYSFFDGMAIVFGSAVRGAGDTRFSVIFSALCAAFCLILPTWIIWRWFGGGMLSGWTACTVYVIVMGVGFLWRFRAGHWMSMRIIEAEPAPISDPELPAADVIPAPHLMPADASAARVRDHVDA